MVVSEVDTLTMEFHMGEIGTRNAARKTWHNVSMHHLGVNGPLK